MKTGKELSMANSQRRTLGTTKDLRSFLTEKMEEVANGEMNTEQCKGIANLAQQVYNTINIEIKVAKARSELGDDGIKPVSFDG